jgi:regulator of protease activity HflC (stomatin/prohibitin superfamily)
LKENMSLRSCSCESGGVIAGFLMLVIVIILIGLGAAYIFGYVVYPGEMGVRQITLGPEQGFSERGLAPGYHWSIPFYSKIHMIPQTIQILNMNRNTDSYPGSPGALEIQTTDGSSVDVDITVFYRFFVKRAFDDDGKLIRGGPADLLTKVGFKGDREMHIQTVVINELKKSLGSLSTAEFYRGKDEENYDFAREHMIVEAKNEMNARLQKVGIGIESILLRRYTYTEQRIDEQIFEKNLQDQEERLNRANSLLAEAKAELEQVEANWDASIKTLKVKGEARARVIVSQGDLYETKKRAAGDLLVAKAEAEVQRLRASALASSLGADIYLAKEMAPVISSLKGGVVTELDPYDLESWMQRLGVSQTVEETK